MGILDVLFNKKIVEGNIPSNSLLKEYIDSLDIETDYVHLDGPFLEERYALKYVDVYKDLLKKTYYRVNLCILRPIAIISHDETLETMDNSRVNLKIMPANHKFEIFKCKNDFQIIGIDGSILLNMDDSNRIKSVINSFPITPQELKTIQNNAII